MAVKLSKVDRGARIRAELKTGLFGWFKLSQAAFNTTLITTTIIKPGNNNIITINSGIDFLRDLGKPHHTKYR